MNYLAAEQRLVELLTPITELRAVLTAADLERVKANAQLAPAVHVLYWGDQLADTAQGGRLSHVTLTWLLVLVLRTDRDSALAGELLPRLIFAVQGQPVSAPAPGSPAPDTFKRINAPARPFHADGFSYYPLAFSHTLKLKGA